MTYHPHDLQITRAQHRCALRTPQLSAQLIAVYRR